MVLLSRKELIMSGANDKVSFVEIEQNVMKKTAENVSERALNAILNFIKNKYGKASVATGSAFRAYLRNSEIRYNKVKTLADLSEPRVLEGTDGIYVDVFVKYKKKKIPMTIVDNVMKISNNIVITGSGGTGKSMMMRHLFLNTHHRGEYIPVLVELRKIGDIKEENALFNLIHYCIESFDVKLNQEQFEYSLRSGKYLFLFDGLDEVKEEYREKAMQLIQEISKKYPDNGYIVSSREEGVSFHELETYTLLKACPLEKNQAIELVKKIGKNDEKIFEFANLLECELYDKHEDFASNPLLLTMMYITFIDNNMIPEHLTDFYDSAYDALYKRHDANKEGLFNREYKCKKVGEREFKDLFAYFCFQSYFSQQYEFSKEEICKYIERGIKRLNLVSSIDRQELFFDDIKDIVCLIVDEGNKYKFAHRSFQTYFAAYYTATHVTDEQQKIFLKKEMDKRHLFREDFFHMLYRLEGERFNINVLETGLEDVLNNLKNNDSPQFAFFKTAYQSLSVHNNILYRGINSAEHMDIPYERNIILLFDELYCVERHQDKVLGEKIIMLLKEQHGFFREKNEIEIEDLARIEPESKKSEILKLLYEYCEVDSLLERIGRWMSEQKRKRDSITENSAKDEMLLLL